MVQAQPPFLPPLSGCFVLAVLAITADKLAAIKTALIFYKPTGVLSDVTTVAILIWRIAWVILDLRWRKKTVPLAQINTVAFLLLFMCFLLTFPPIAELF